MKKKVVLEIGVGSSTRTGRDIRKGMQRLGWYPWVLPTTVTNRQKPNIQTFHAFSAIAEQGHPGDFGGSILLFPDPHKDAGGGTR